MLKEPISIDGKPQGKCIAKRCEDCAFYRQWEVLVNPITNETQLQKKCSFEAIFYVLPRVIGSVDGCQKAANEARNNSLEVKGIVAKATEDYIGSVRFLSQRFPKLLEE